ncbi:hypothetical protein ACQEVF_32325 [Nonomuraea polychroma]|uniref:hypothetical protein n=1 Tax=Nonomuraea polychroma TaxID=46176 RepID=UPI003D8EA0AE
MTRPTFAQVAHSMWENRPTLSELLGWTAVTLIGCWATGLPLILFGMPVGLMLAAGTLQMALADLRKTRSLQSAQREEGGRNAED